MLLACRFWPAAAATDFAATATTSCVCRQAALFVLYESASGYSLFEIKGLDEVGQAAHKVQESVR
jgi:carotenoid cleavage dioxygenase-like enzyme